MGEKGSENHCLFVELCDFGLWLGGEDTFSAVDKYGEASGVSGVAKSCETRRIEMHACEKFPRH